METYINAKTFKNDDISLLFKKDLISVQELVDKIYELLDEEQELKDRIEELEDDLHLTSQELSSAKLGFRP